MRSRLRQRQRVRTRGRKKSRPRERNRDRDRERKLEIEVAEMRGRVKEMIRDKRERGILWSPHPLHSLLQTGKLRVRGNDTTS